MKESMNKKLKKLLIEQRFAVIATQDKDKPYTNLVSFLSNNKLNKIYFPTSKRTKKFQNLLENPKISILIDNRVNKPKDIKNAIVVTGIGKSKEIKEKKVINEFIKKHPYLESFIKTDDSAMIEIDIQKYIIVNNFENVETIIIN